MISIKDSLFLEDLAPNFYRNDILTETNEIDHLLDEAMILFYECNEDFRNAEIEYRTTLLEMLNEADDSGSIKFSADGVRAINSWFDDYDGYINGLYRSMDKNKEAADKVIKSYKEISPEKYKDLKELRISNFIMISVKGKHLFSGLVAKLFHSEYTFVSQEVIDSIEKELDKFIQNFDQPDEKLQKKMMKDFVKNNNYFYVDLNAWGKPMMITNFQDYMNKFCNFIQKDFSNFSNKLNKIKSMLQKYKNDGILKKLRARFSKIKSALNSIVMVINSYIRNAKAICGCLKIELNNKQ